MQVYDLIEKKRDNITLTKEEIDYLIEEYTKGTIPDYQFSAFLMAVYFNGMTDEELYNFTMAMTNSGDVFDLSEIKEKIVDKHSTGGVGDKTTLIVAPIVASLGIKIAKMSGRGLGFTGGTADKLESIEGYNTYLSKEKFLKQVNDINIGLITQSDNIAKADKKIYALRDVTATIESIPLIASSIMSKKLASGASSIVLDVKVGSGAFMKDFSKAQELAQKMVAIGKKANKNMVALITNMDTPLGNYIGNSLEVIEAIDILQGRGPEDLYVLSIALAAFMVKIAKNISLEEAKNLVIDAINSGQALNKFKELVKAQGGNVEYIDNTSLFPKAKYEILVKSNQKGYISSMNTEEIGKIAGLLGAGRSKKDDAIDYSAGIILKKKTGDYVLEDDVLAILYTNKENLVNIENRYINTITYSEKEVEKLPIIKEIIE